MTKASKFLLVLVIASLFAFDSVLADSQSLSGFLGDHPLLDEHKEPSDLSPHEASLQRCKQSGNLEKIVDSLSWLGNLARRNGIQQAPAEKKRWYLMAEKYLCEQVDYARQLVKKNPSNSKPLWKALFELAYLHEQQYKYVTAEKCCKEAVELLRLSPKHRRRLVHGLEFHAKQLQFLEKFKEAEKKVLEAKNVFTNYQKSKQPDSLPPGAKDYTYLRWLMRELRAARLYSAWGKDDKADRHYQKAISTAVKNNDLFQAAQCAIYHGDFLERANDLNAASKAFDRALGFLSHLNCNDHTRYAALRMASICRKSGRASSAAKYEEHAKQACMEYSEYFGFFLALLEAHGYNSFTRP